MGSVRGARGDFVDSLGVLLSQGVRKRRRICWAGQIFGERLAQLRVDEVDLACTPDPSHGTPVVLDVCSCRGVGIDDSSFQDRQGIEAFSDGSRDRVRVIVETNKERKSGTEI